MHLSPVTSRFYAEYPAKFFFFPAGFATGGTSISGRILSGGVVRLSSFSDLGALTRIKFLSDSSLTRKLAGKKAVHPVSMSISPLTHNLAVINVFGKTNCRNFAKTGDAIRLNGAKPVSFDGANTDV
ncbi:hypothetical protein [Thalassospira sp. TSL5-1]|uniref:hypothetical protein n=1 Tax=Thalassospira sp. TSL5-1 TaxID=1544451 RepID=UPI00093AFE06|nr:hypothetical protein [Thalassospira sp. TSL5-1]OKH89446.1 hypothetical protein LF95_05555 [Thalassospira sp. TSL5-1]